MLGHLVRARLPDLSLNPLIYFYFNFTIENNNNNNNNNNNKF